MSKSLRPIALVVASIALLAAQTGVVYATGIVVRKPVFGEACKLCPCGAMGQVVKNAMQFYGYDVQLCYNCNAADSTRIVAGIRVPPPYHRGKRAERTSI
jgi:hypothetical protein